MKAKILPISGSSDYIRLSADDSWHFPMSKAFRNPARVNSRDQVVWTAELPTTGAADSFVNAEIEEVEVVAWSWSGFRVKIDLATGRSIETVFTK